jgi:hypothetical protein
MISKPIDIKTFEVVQRVIVGDIIGKDGVPEYRNQVRRMKDSVNMNDRENRISVVVKIRANHPHACIVVRLFGDVTIPMNQCTRISGAKKEKRKETYDPRDLHTAHAIDLVIAVHKYTIIVWHPLAPRRCRSNDFLSHAFNVAWVTRCVECRDCTVDDADTAHESWTGVVWVFMITIIVQLFAQKVIDESWEVRQIELIR